MNILKKILGVSLVSLAISLPFATDASAYYYGGYHRYGTVVVGGPYYPYAYPPPYYAPPPPPYAYAPPPYPYAAPVAYPAPVYAAPPVVGLGIGLHIR